MEDEIVRLLKTINDISPFVYEAARGQVRVGMVQDIVGLVFIIILIIGFARFNKGRDLLKDNPIAISAFIIISIISIISLIVLPILVFDLVQIWLNPDWYIIKSMLRLVEG